MQTKKELKKVKSFSITEREFKEIKRKALEYFDGNLSRLIIEAVRAFNKR